ncbi:MAG: hypothetical protein DRO04_00560 [Candidatus Iainarchaeum archaeon]|uniref:Prefoldin subunit beta n=1 Tax=Candidatus Iainarchaeum sp. TaxID=3101447 RepID=A0A497JI00_9ARCH|nr:MAG: hypothetical protein DRO04_00560 [Candidatus Diapherotrites archaeon]
MNREELQKAILEFERNRAQLINISNQKQQLQLHVNVLKNAIDELSKTSEEKVYQLVGNIMIQKDTKQVKKELEEQKETAEMRIKALQKQEDALMDKLNKLRAEIESSQGALAAEPEEKESKSEEKKK